MDDREKNLLKDRMIADTYARAVAAALATNDPGILPDAEGRKAVVGLIRVMKRLNASEWGWYDEEII